MEQSSGQVALQGLPVEWTGINDPVNQTIHALFERQVAETRDAVAVEFNSDRLTYRELNRRANALAAELRLRGCGDETPVGLFVERSLDMLVGVLGVLKAGGAYVPLDPFFPQERLAFMIADAEIPLLVTQRHRRNDLPKHEAQVVCVDALDEAPLSSPARRSPSSSANLAYILYTSGSTGRPKGVQISHRAVVSLLQAMRQAPGFDAEDVLPAITTLAFDIAVLELFLPLITGGKVVIASREVAMDGRRLAKLISDCGATVMQATPATWRMLIESGWLGDRRLKILCGGEALTQDLAKSLLERGRELWNMYGPTETTVYSIIDRLLPGQTVTIGRPIANTKAYILDEELKPVRIGAVGELYIGGNGVARGYLGRPELTSERFVPDPFDGKTNGRIYKTGDLARSRSDGRIEFLGRADHQIKLRGFRVELGEIEAALAQVDGVAQAVVVARDAGTGDKRLVAYIVPKESPLSPPDPSSLRAALQPILPHYMIPSAFVFLQTLPLTPTRKVDRKALPEPGPMANDLRDLYEPPVGETEERLALIIASLLKVPRVGRKDSFFDLGGHSIVAATLFNEIDRVFGKRLPLATLYRASTIEHLATELENRPNRIGEWSSLVPIQPHGTKARFFSVHGAGGNVLLYRDLARHFGGDYAFYGLQSQGLDGKDSPLTSVEEMAEKYVGEIRSIQPEGPYFVGGYCVGGTIAYEIAQLLRRDGHEVALVALLDTYNFARKKRWNTFGYLRQKIAFHLSNLTHLPPKNWPAYISSKLRVAMEGEFSALLKVLRRSFKKKASSDSPLESVQEANDRAAEAYRPKPYAGRVTVFKPKVNYDFYPDAQLGWGDLVTGRLHIIELPVNPHAMLMEPYVQTLADRLKEAVGKAASQPRAGRMYDFALGVLISESFLSVLPFLGPLSSELGI